MITTTKNGLPRVQKYIAILNQAGTGNPTANVLANTFGDIVWTRTGVGVYEGTPATGLVLETDKSMVMLQPATTADSVAYIYSYVNLNKVIINSYGSAAPGEIDGLLYLELSVANY